MANESESVHSECTHDCSTCKANCASRDKTSMLEAQNKLSHIDKVIAVVSGQGGVGKSLVTSMLAVGFARRGNRVAILDADITGPSIPRIFGAKGEILGNDNGMVPYMTETGIEMMSVNLLLDKESTPVVWRGPVISGTVKQFWTDVVWGDVNYMFVDMPPGTGDVPLTVFQSLPLDGVVIVTSPQELVSMIVKKAVNMANLMHIPVLGLIENMSYLKCPDCGREIRLFGDSHIEEVAEEFGLPVLAKLPLDPALAELCDAGEIERMKVDYMDNAVAEIEKRTVKAK